MSRGMGAPMALNVVADGGGLREAGREHVAAPLAQEAREQPDAAAEHRLVVEPVGEADARQEGVLRRRCTAARCRRRPRTAGRPATLICGTSALSAGSLRAAYRAWTVAWIGWT